MRRNSDGALLAAVADSQCVCVWVCVCVCAREWVWVCVCVCVCECSTGESIRMRGSSRLSCSRTKLSITQHTLRLFRKLTKYDWSTEQTLSWRIHIGNSLLKAWVFIFSSITVQLNKNSGLCFTRSSVPYIHRSPQPISTTVTTEKLRKRTHNITIPASSLTFL